MTDATTLLCLAMLLLPLTVALTICIVRAPLLRDRLNVIGAIAHGRRRAHRGRPRRDRHTRLGARRLATGRRHRRTLSRRGRSRGPVQRARLTGVSAHRPRVPGQRGHRTRLVLRLPACLLGGAPCAPPGRQPRRRMGPHRGHDRGLGTARCPEPLPEGARGRLEVPRPHHGRPRGGPARHRRRERCRPRRGRAGRTLVAGARCVGGAHASQRGAGRFRPDRRRAGDQDRVGAGAQLAAGRAQRGAAARLRPALGGPASHRHARRLAHT